jgi:MHS family shikimate/dehydroshikimate transporter-like MFS transporter
MLVILRLVQGFGAGAEYGGAVILAVEHAPPGRRGLFGSFAAIGVNIGLLLATGVFALVSSLPKEDFLSWGWRIPFLLSIALILVGFYIRIKVSETPVFSQIAAKSKAARSPVKDAFTKHPREFLVVFGARLAENGLGYLYPVFTLSYMTKTLLLPKSMVLSGIMAAYAISLVTVPLFSMLSDRIGRRPVYGGAALFSAAFAFPFFMMVNTGSATLIWIALIVAISIGVSGMFGPQAAYFAELFGPKLRYSGFASARELGSILAGGPAPFLAAWLLGQGNNEPWLVATYMVTLAILTAIAIYCGPETYKSDIRADAVASKI